MKVIFRRAWNGRHHLLCIKMWRLVFQKSVGIKFILIQRKKCYNWNNITMQRIIIASWMYYIFMWLKTMNKFCKWQIITLIKSTPFFFNQSVLHKLSNLMQPFSKRLLSMRIALKVRHFCFFTLLEMYFLIKKKVLY